MKTPPVILVLAAVLIGPFFALAQNPPAGFWREWMKHPEVSAAIITKGLSITPSCTNCSITSESPPFTNTTLSVGNGPAPIYCW